MPAKRAKITSHAAAFYEQYKQEHAELLAHWQTEMLDGAPLAEHALVKRLEDDIGDIESWPNCALQLHRRELHRGHGRYRCLTTLLVVGVDPAKLVDYLLHRGSLQHSENAVRDVIGIILHHKCGELKTTVDGMKVPMQVEAVSGPTGRWGPCQLSCETTVPVRAGILPGRSTTGQPCYPAEITDLERCKKGSKRALPAERARNAWDGTGLPLESYKWAQRKIAAFKLPDIRGNPSLAYLNNCDWYGTHVLQGQLYAHCKNHDIAICKLWQQIHGHRAHALSLEARIRKLAYC